MKCIKVINGISQELKNVPNNTILRVNDEAALKFVNNDEAVYIPKYLWKEQESKLNQQKGEINETK